MKSLRLTMLGGFHVRDTAGEEIAISGTKAALLLGCLALRPGEAHSREKLMGLLWSNRGESQARGSLRQALWALRRALEGLEPCPLIVDGEMLALDPAAVETDIATFESLVSEASPQALQSAVTLYRGELLGGLRVRDPAFESYLRTEQERLHELAIDACTRLLEHQLQTGVSDAAAATAKRLLTIDPLQEAAHRALMEYHANKGRLSLAVKQYRACRDTLQRELRLEPDAETERLFDRIRLDRSGAADRVSHRDEAAREGRGDRGPPPPPRQEPGPAADGDGAFDLSHFDRPSVVVMPFKDLGGGDRDSLAEGLRLSLHSMLVKLSGLFLLHTGTVEGYREQEVSAVEVGKDIDVRYVVEGSVRHSGDRVRISMQVTDTPAGQLILAERYDRVLDDIFDLEDEIALEVVGALDIELRSGEVGRAWWQGITDPAIRVHVHRGLSHLYKGTKNDNAAARRIYEKIDELQPDWPQCLGLMALTHWRDAQFGWSTDPDDSLIKAAALAERAVDLGDPDGIALAVIGHVRLHQRRHQEALEFCSESITRRPSCPLANGLLAEVMQFCGNPGQAIVHIKDAIRHVRVYPPWMVNIMAACFRDNDDLEASISAATEAVRKFPDDLDGRVILCSAYDFAASPGEAEMMARQIVQVDPSFTISRYAASQPYKDQATLDHIIESLNRAGLPE